ncbi:MAG: hypothetical protein M1284_03025 [Candidatus Parvarchaeota archaeon]|jgi:hypothetical protein|nr:hypothetical protein [Candidatus Parvarchaeota archaeon]MCL5420696.1 hypothetical protein [Candidatus Parvarchaeota archaeon]
MILSFFSSSFDAYYRVISFLLNAVAFSFFFYGIYTLKKSPKEFLAKLFVNHRRTVISFFLLALSAVFIAIGYILTGLISISNPGTIIWEYTNLLAYSALAVFSIIFFVR